MCDFKESWVIRLKPIKGGMVEREGREGGDGHSHKDEESEVEREGDPWGGFHSIARTLTVCLQSYMYMAF